MASPTKLFGQIIHISEEQVFGDKGFKKRELHLQTIEQFPNFYNIEFTQKNCDLLNDFKVGENVGVFYNLNGRKYEKEDGSTAVFNSVAGWKIESLNTQTPNSAIEKYTDQKEEEIDDLPY